MNNSVPLLSIKDLHKSFGKREILKGINFDVEKGQVISIIGQSGSGKSTLIRCINFLEMPTAGIISYEGKDVLKTFKDLPLYRTKVGMVFQSFNLFNNMNVLENCTVGQIKVLKIDRQTAEDKARKYLLEVGMADYVQAKPQQLSGGQKQRVAIARALALEPNILLLDEPTSALDSEMVGEVLDIISKLAKQGMTMLIVTHEIAFARDVSSKIIFLDKGVVAEEDTPEVMFNAPNNPRTAEFLARFNRGR